LKLAAISGMKDPVLEAFDSESLVMRQSIGERTSPSGRGHKLKDWRVALDRLGMMRLLHRFRPGEIRERFPAGWKAFAGFEWYKERKRAGATFKKLFPFLPKAERPLSWPTKGGRGKN